MSFSNGYLPKTTAESMLKFDRWYKTNSFPWYKVRYLRKMRQAFQWESSSTGVLFLCTYTLDKRFSRIAGRYDWITRNLLVSSLCVRMSLITMLYLTWWWNDLVKKCKFSIYVYVVWCPTWSKNFGRSLRWVLN